MLTLATDTQRPDLDLTYSIDDFTPGTHRDSIFLIQAIVFVVALMVVIVNIAIDVSYKALDPRVKLA